VRRTDGRFKSNTAASTFLAYGGWWEDKSGVRNDNDFNNNGLVSADRKPHPGLYALKYVYRYLHVQPVDLGAGPFLGASGRAAAKGRISRSAGMGRSLGSMSE